MRNARALSYTFEAREGNSLVWNLFPGASNSVTSITTRPVDDDKSRHFKARALSDKLIIRDVYKSGRRARNTPLSSNRLFIYVYIYIYIHPITDYRFTIRQGFISIVGTCHRATAPFAIRKSYDNKPKLFAGATHRVTLLLYTLHVLLSPFCLTSRTLQMSSWFRYRLNLPPGEHASGDWDAAPDLWYYFVREINTYCCVVVAAQQWYLADRKREKFVISGFLRGI